MEVPGKRPRKVKEQHLSQTSKNLIEQRGMFKRRDPILQTLIDQPTLNLIN